LRTANSEDDLRNVIAEAHLKQFPLKVIGSLHSANTIWFAGKPEDPPAVRIAVDISQIKHVNINDNSTSAWVGAGIKLEDLLLQLEAKGLCVDALGGVAHQSIAGIISTGTLPASPVLNMSFVKALRVLKWDESKQEVVEETVDCTSSDYMLSLGMLYVIVEAQVNAVTYACRMP
jgi:FAD/FMN-containing dehydrogenase